MRVNSVDPGKNLNKTSFGRYDYENKSIAGKALGLGLFLGTTAEKIRLYDGIGPIIDEYHKELAQSIGKEASVKIDNLSTPLLKQMANRNFYASMLISAAIFIGLGAIFDGIIDKTKE